jgi:hypothetical protein
MVFECQAMEEVEDAARQVLQYSGQCEHPPALALFGVITRVRMVTIHEELRERQEHGRPAKGTMSDESGRSNTMNVVRCPRTP